MLFLLGYDYLLDLIKHKVKCAKNPVRDEYLVMVATKAMMGSQHFPRADDDWEELNLLNKDWTA